VRARLLLRASALSGETAEFVDLDGFSACALRPSGNSVDYRILSLALAAARSRPYGIAAATKAARFQARAVSPTAGRL
jgi:hypothetical protein